jgi:hypothetical protein
MRGKTFTPLAKQLAIAKLEKFRNSGFNPREILENSIMNSWKGLFEPQPKGNRNENTGRNFAYRDKSAEARAAIERALGTTILDDEERRTW